MRTQAFIGYVSAGLIGAALAGATVLALTQSKEAWIGFSGSILGGLVGGLVTVVAAVFAALQVADQLAEARRQSAAAARSAIVPLATDLEQEIETLNLLHQNIERIKDIQSDAWGVHDISSADKWLDYSVATQKETLNIVNKLTFYRARNSNRSPFFGSRVDLIVTLQTLIGTVQKYSGGTVEEFVGEFDDGPTAEQFKAAKLSIYDETIKAEQLTASHLAFLDGHLEKVWNRIRELEVAALGSEFRHHADSPAANTSSRAPMGPSATP